MLPEGKINVKKIMEAKRAMEFADKMNILQQQRDGTLRKFNGELSQSLINTTFDNEEAKLKKEYGVKEYVQGYGNQGYGRVHSEPESEPIQEYGDGRRESAKESIAEVHKDIVQEKLTALEASARYLTYDEWKCGLTKAPDWVYDKGMSEENNPQAKEAGLTQRKKYGTISL